MQPLGNDFVQLCFQPRSLAFQDFDVNVGWQLAGQFQQNGVDVPGNVYGVACWGFQHVQADAGLSIGARNRTGLRCVDFHNGDIGDADRRRVGAGTPVARGAVRSDEADRQIVDGVQVGVTVKRAQRYRAAFGYQAASSDIDFVTLNGANDVLESETVGVQQVGVDSYEYLLADASFDFHGEYAGHGFQARHDLGLDNLLQRRNIPLTRHAQFHHGPLVWGQLINLRVASRIGQPDAGHPADDFRFRFFDVCVGLEAGPHQRTATPRCRSYFLQSFHADDDSFDWPGDLFRDFDGGSLLVRCNDVDDPKANLWEQLLLQLLVRINSPNQRQNEGHNCYRTTLQGKFGQNDHLIHLIPVWLRLYESWSGCGHDLHYEPGLRHIPRKPFFSIQCDVRWIGIFDGG